MPPTKNCAQVVFGDRVGRSAAPWLMAEAMATAANRGFAVASNDPFAGGHVLDRHGAPHRGVHAIQVEIDRRCYLTAGGQPGEGFDSIAALIEALALTLGESLLDRRMAQAAE
jgi:N-formylglutamate amidohydrolase